MIHGVIIERIEDYNNLKRYRVDYMKNGYSQKAVFMDFSGDWKLIETEHYSRNGLRADEKKELIGMIRKIDNEIRKIENE